MKSKILTALLLATFLINVALSRFIPDVSAQFVDRLVRPCQTGGTSGTVQVTTTNILINPCPGGSVTINGTAITPGPGIAINPTIGTVPYKSAAAAFGDSPITRLSATHMQFFANAPGGADFDSSAPAITLNGAGAVTKIGNAAGLPLITVNGTGTPAVTMLAHVINLTNGGNTNIYSDDTFGGYIQLVTGNGISDPQIELDDSGASPLVTISAPLGTVKIQSLSEFQLGRNIKTGTASNTDTAGQLTVGAGGTITYTFTQSYASAPICTSSDTNAAPNITGASASTTVLTVTGTVGHVVNYICVGRN